MLIKSSTRALVHARILFSVCYIYNTAIVNKQQKGATS